MTDTHVYRFLNGVEVDPREIRDIGEPWMSSLDTLRDRPVAEYRMGFGLTLKDGRKIPFDYTIDDLLGAGSVLGEEQRVLAASRRGLHEIQLRADVAAALAPNAFDVLIKDLNGLLNLASSLAKELNPDIDGSWA